MPWILFTIGMFLLFWVMLIFKGKIARSLVPVRVARDPYGRPAVEANVVDSNVHMRESVERWIMIGYGVLAVIWFMGTLGNSFHQVDKKHIGLVSTFGKITDQRTAGFAMTMPWQTFEEVDVRTQYVCADGSQPVKNDCSSQYVGFAKGGTIDVYVKGVTNYHVSGDKIQELITDVGFNYKDNIILPRISQVIKEETIKYAVEDIATKREEIRIAVRETLTKELEKRSIVVEDFLLINIEPQKDIKDAINAKAIEQQKALAAEQTVKLRIQEANQAEEQAKGQANAARAAAQGRADAVLAEARAQAEANRLLDQSLTPNIIQLEAIKRFNPAAQLVIVPNGSGNFFDFGQILQKAVTQAAPAPAPQR